MISSFLKKLGALLGVLIGNIAMGTSFSLINTNLSLLNEQFGASLLELQWIINTYGIFIASSLVLMGRLGDLFGRKKIYLTGLGCFITSMLISGLAPSTEWIIASQTLYGFAGGIILPLSLSLIIDVFDAKDKSQAVGLWASVGGLAMAAGPLVGGVTMDFLSWRWTFLINIPLALVGLFLTLFFVKESKGDIIPSQFKGKLSSSKALDLPGGILLMLTIGLFVLGLVQSNVWPLFVTLLLILSSFILLFLLLRVEKKAKIPILYLELFCQKQFLFSSVIIFCMIAILWGEIFLIPLFAQELRGFSNMETSLLMLCFTLPAGLFSHLSGHLYHKIEPRAQMGAGFLLFLVGTIMEMSYTQESSCFFIAFATLLLGLGFSFIWTCATTSALAHTSKEVSGIASGTFITVQEIGGSVGLGVAGTLLRNGNSLLLGFHHAMWVIFTLCCIGLFAAYLLPSKKPRRSF